MNLNRARPKTEKLPNREWDFFSDSKQIPQVYEWNAWLNYEYARSCRPIVEAVRQIRGDQVMEKAPYRFAVFLAKNFPEFPVMPWLKMSAARRGQLRDDGIIPKIDPFEERLPLLVHDIDEFVRDLENGDRVLTGSLMDQRFSVIEINFNSEDHQIRRAFAEWLEQRRKALLERYRDPSELRSGRTFNPAIAFQAKPSKRPPGQARNKRQYKNYLKRLAALRQAVFHKDKKGADRFEMFPGGRNFYHDERSLQRAADEAADLMMRFVDVWKYCYGFPFILDPKRNVNEPLLGVRGGPLPLSGSQLKVARPLIRAFINRDVQISAGT